METDVILVGQSWQKDALLQDVPVPKERTIPATVLSVTRSEWVSAGQNSVDAELTVRTPVVNYEGEGIVKIAGNRYSVYRTYRDEETDTMELYLRREAGVL